MGDWMKKDEDGRWRADLHALPREISLTLAVATVAVVVLLGRRFDPDPALPGWLPAAIDTAAMIILGASLVFAVKWVVLRRRRRVPDRRRTIQE